MEVPALVAGVGSEVAMEEALRTRHSEGVKNEEGVEVAVGELTDSAENFDLDRHGRAVWMIMVDDKLRFEAAAEGVKKEVDWRIETAAGR